MSQKNEKAQNDTKESFVSKNKGKVEDIVSRAFADSKKGKILSAVSDFLGLPDNKPDFTELAESIVTLSNEVETYNRARKNNGLPEKKPEEVKQQFVESYKKQLETGKISRENVSLLLSFYMESGYHNFALLQQDVRDEAVKAIGR